MPSTVRIVMNVAGYNAYRNSPSVTAAVQQAADELADRWTAAARTWGDAHGVTPPAGEDVEVGVSHGPTRVRVNVRAASVRARLAEQTDRILLQALGGQA